jgi:hypothetical protein
MSGKVSCPVLVQSSDPRALALAAADPKRAEREKAIADGSVSGLTVEQKLALCKVDTNGWASVTPGISGPKGCCGILFDKKRSSQDFCKRRASVDRCSNPHGPFCPTCCALFVSCDTHKAGKGGRSAFKEVQSSVPPSKRSKPVRPPAAAESDAEDSDPDDDSAVLAMAGSGGAAAARSGCTTSFGSASTSATGARPVMSPAEAARVALAARASAKRQSRRDRDGDGSDPGSGGDVGLSDGSEDDNLTDAEGSDAGGRDGDGSDSGADDVVRRDPHGAVRAPVRLRDIDVAGELMRLMAKSNVSAVTMYRRRNWRDARNKHEALSLATAFDFLVLGRRRKAMDQLARRLQALLLSDKNGNYTFADALNKYVVEDECVIPELELMAMQDVARRQSVERRVARPTYSGGRGGGSWKFGGRAHYDSAAVKHGQYFNDRRQQQHDGFGGSRADERPNGSGAGRGRGAGRGGSAAGASRGGRGGHRGAQH